MPRFKPVYLTLVVPLLLGTSPTGRRTTSTYVLIGSILTPDVVIPHGSVVVQGDKILAVKSGTDSSYRALLIPVAGLIIPGMIDLHDHLAWNVLPRWRPRRLFRNRYEWQAIPEYGNQLVTPEITLAKTVRCEMDRYAEIKALVGAATAVTGSPTLHATDPADCLNGLARNLDSQNGLPRSGTLSYAVFPMEMGTRWADSMRQRIMLRDGSTVLAHIAEGTDASSEREFRMFKADSLLHFGTTIIHGLGLSAADFSEMANDSVGLVWSPRSNFELYGSTTNVAAARAAGVTIAIAPDWSPTGSSGMLNELRYAAEWNRRQRPPVFTDSQLVQMTTSIPAQLAQVESLVGHVQPLYYADLVVLSPRPGLPYSVVVGSTPADVELVIVAGQPLYGDSGLMSALLPGQRFEMTTVCGRRRAFSLSAQGNGNPLAKTEEVLRRKLELLQSSLAPLQECT